jgi:hypothetical protein
MTKIFILSYTCMCYGMGPFRFSRYSLRTDPIGNIFSFSFDISVTQTPGGEQHREHRYEQFYCCYSDVAFRVPLLCHSLCHYRFQRTCYNTILYKALLTTCFQAGTLLRFFFDPESWRRYVPSKRRLTFNGLQALYPKTQQSS